MRVLRQKRYEPLDDWKQALMIYAVSEGFAAEVAPEKIEEFDLCLCEYFEHKRPDLVSSLKTGSKMDDELAGRVKQAIADFREEYVCRP